MYLSLSGVGQGFFAVGTGAASPYTARGCNAPSEIASRFHAAPLALIEILQKNFKTEIIFIAFCEFVLYTDINT